MTMSRFADADQTQPWDRDEFVPCARCGVAIEDTDLCDDCRAERRRLAERNEEIYIRAIRTFFQKTEPAS
ncbi:MAG TPA: hypothetical protein VGJ22_01960 [Anaerolineales bacterium]|jgi:hypothetical protein